MERDHRPGHPAHLPVAIFVDVDGTLASPYRQGRRELRPSALQALAMLSAAAPVFLWSAVGADNAERLLREFPALRPYIRGCHAKVDCPHETVGRAYAIDDEVVDTPVLDCHQILLVDSYRGGPGDDDFLRLVSVLIEEIGRG